MCQRKSWSKEEDQLLCRLMVESELADPGRRLKWNEIAVKVTEQFPGRARKGKQCRQRWFNQLQPGINREAEWTAEEQALLFQLQAVHGNKWARIAREMVGRSDNNIKNYFYSTLRKAIRRVNNYVTSHKHCPPYKNTKAFQINTLNKILTVAENKADKKIILGKQSAANLAKQIRDMLISLQMPSTQENSNESEPFMNILVAKIQDFNRVCKRRKSKKKQQSSCENNSDEMEDSEQNPNSQSPSQDHSIPKEQFNSITSVRPDGPLVKQQPESPDNSQEEPIDRRGIGIIYMDKEPLALVKARKQPIIPTLDHSNWLNQSSKSSSQGEPTVRNSQQLQQSPSLQGERLPLPRAPELGYVPLMHPSYYAGSPFMPNPFFPRPYFGYPLGLHPNHYPGFGMGWEHDFGCKREEEQIHPFLNYRQRPYQFEKGAKMEGRE